MSLRRQNFPGSLSAVLLEAELAVRFQNIPAGNALKAELAIFNADPAHYSERCWRTKLHHAAEKATVPVDAIAIEQAVDPYSALCRQ